MRFLQTYVKPEHKILDVGSMDVNGTLKACVPQGATYTGLDMSPGKNVDVVLETPYQFPFSNESFDVVISSSCLEHDPMFWLTFSEMVRVGKEYIYISVPMAGGDVHRHPVDCWRFFPDAGKALEKWANHRRQRCKLLESFCLRPRADTWFDFVGVFGLNRDSKLQNLSNFFPDAFEVFKQ